MRRADRAQGAGLRRDRWREVDRGRGGRRPRSRIAFDEMIAAVGPQPAAEGLRAGRAGHPGQPGHRRPTSISRRSTPTSLRRAMWLGPTSSPTPPRIRPGSPASTRFSALQAVQGRLPGDPLGDLPRPRGGPRRPERTGGARKGHRVRGRRASASTTLTAPSPMAPREGFVKVLTVPGRDRILGVTIVGDHAGDLLAEYVLAMKHGLGLNKILGTIHTYPTLGRGQQIRGRRMEEGACQPAQLCAGWSVSIPGEGADDDRRATSCRYSGGFWHLRRGAGIAPASAPTRSRWPGFGVGRSGGAGADLWLVWCGTGG